MFPNLRDGDSIRNVEIETPQQQIMNLVRDSDLWFTESTNSCGGGVDKGTFACDENREEDA